MSGSNPTLRTIGPYTIRRELGHGSFGVVLHVEREGRPYALKILHDDVQEDDELVGRFEREVRLMQRLDHPGVIGVRDVGRHDGRLYCVMDLVRGQDLKRILRARAPLPVREAVDLARQITKALQAAHELGMVHRDVKPSNVMVEDGSGFARLGDFGMARHRWSRDRLTQTGAILGTPSYMAPEQFLSAKVDHRADLYAVGAILYQALGGRVPHVADSLVDLEEKVLSGDRPRLRELRPDVPAALEEIVERALAHDPSDRYRSAADLQADLGAFLQTYLEGGPSPTSPTPSSALLIGLGALILLLAAGIGIAALRSDEAPSTAETPAPDPVEDPPVPEPAAPTEPAPTPEEILATVFLDAEGGADTDELLARLRDAPLDPLQRASASARLAFRRGRLRDAVTFAEPLIGSRDRLAREALLARGLAETFLFRFADATGTLHAVAAVDDPTGWTAKAFLPLADDYIFTPEDYANAQDLLIRARAREPDLLTPLLCLTYYRVAKNDPQALDLCDDAARRAPDHWLPKHMRGRYLRLKPGHASDAVENLRQASILTGGDCEPTLNYLVQALVLDRQREEAGRWLERARSRHPESFSLMAAEAALLEIEGRSERALQVFAELVSKAGARRTAQELHWLPPGLQQPAVRVRERYLRGGY